MIMKGREKEKEKEEREKEEKAEKQTKNGGSSHHGGLGPLSLILGDSKQISFALLGSLIHAAVEK